MGRASFNQHSDIGGQQRFGLLPLASHQFHCLQNLDDFLFPSCQSNCESDYISTGVVLSKSRCESVCRPSELDTVFIAYIALLCSKCSVPNYAHNSFIGTRSCRTARLHEFLRSCKGLEEADDLALAASYLKYIDDTTFKTIPGSPEGSLFSALRSSIHVP